MKLLTNKLKINLTFLPLLLLLLAWLGSLVQILINPNATILISGILFLTGMVLMIILTLRNKQLEYEKKVSSFIFTMLFLLASGFGLYSMQAVPYGYAVAQAKTEQLQAAAQLGFEVAQAVNNGQQTLPSATDNIASLLPPDLVPTAHDSLVKTLVDNTPTSQQAVQESAPTVKVKYNEWSCNQLGCAYGESAQVWTVTWKSRVEGSVLFLISLAMMYLTTKKPRKSSL